MISIDDISATDVVLVHIDHNKREENQRILELETLVFSVDLKPIATVRFKVKQISSKTLLGSGQLKSLQKTISNISRRVGVVFNQDLSPRQQQVIQKELCVDVIDRTQVIFKLFSKRATTHIGQLQVELALLRYAATRLVRGWTHLERQRGGIGVRGGPGESQLEIDRRLLQKRIEKLTHKIAKIHTQRHQNRKQRLKRNMPTVAIMGYTNSGKTTLYNALTKQHQYVEDQVFATLDPKAGRMSLSDYSAAILIDTVGFVTDLPDKLLEAFSATLHEINYADVICVVVDATSTQTDSEIATIHDMIEKLGLTDVPKLTLLNKSDLVDHEDVSNQGILISAKYGFGIERFKEKLSNVLLR